MKIEKMRRLRSMVMVLALSPAVFLLAPTMVHGALNHGPYTELLNKYVDNGVVDYRGFKAEEHRLDEYLKILEHTDTRSLSPEDQFAFYVNAYNAWTIKLILGAYPGVKSIKELGSLLRSPWKKKIVRIDGDVFSLDHVEHGIIRPRFKDPRVHFAVNCASKGCPPLIDEPFDGTTLDRQLDTATRAFISDPEKNRLEGNTLYASKIFKWYTEDFTPDIVGFFKKYVTQDLKEKLSAGTIKVKYLDYDWSLNGA